MKNLRNKNAPPNADLVQVYLSSSWDIVTDIYKNLDLLVALGEALANGDLADFLTAADIDTLAEINAILTDAVLGAFSSEAQAIAGLDNTTTMTPLRVAQAIVGGAGILNNFTAVTNPGVGDDSADGYVAGSVWMNVDPGNEESWRCSDPTAGAAVWIKTTLTSDELATVALTGNSDDLIEGVVQLLLTVGERATIAAIDQVFTSAEKTKLTNIETAATADQTDGEIEIAYNAQVAQVSAGEKTAGTELAIRRFSPDDVKDMAVTHASTEVVDDLTPQLGGDLDVNGQEITSAGVIILNPVTGLTVKVNDVLRYAMNDSGLYPADDDQRTLGLGNSKWSQVFSEILSLDKYLYFSDTYTVGSLPAATTERILVTVSDALAPVNGSVVVGGGAEHALVYSTTAATWVVVAGGTTAAGDVATDAIWDAAGDLAVGTGADTGAKLAMGNALEVLRVNAGATALEYAAPAAGGGGGLTVEFKTADFTAVASYKYFVDTTLGAVVVTLPAGGNLDNIKIVDSGHNAAINNITIIPDGA